MVMLKVKWDLDCNGQDDKGQSSVELTIRMPEPRGRVAHQPARSLHLVKSEAGDGGGGQKLPEKLEALIEAAQALVAHWDA